MRVVGMIADETKTIFVFDIERDIKENGRINRI